MRTSRLLAAILLLAAPTPLSLLAQGSSATETATIQVPFETYRLPNGLNVILSRATSVPVVAVNLWYHVGSANEEPGRTGFAHLFEHMMFQGSQNVGDDQHFRIIEEAGGTLNGTTNPDRTNYFEAVPSNYLETILFLEADRMANLLPAVTEEKLANQRDVVKNERRQRYENAPYGLAYETLSSMLYPAGHPYHHTTIGSMADLSAASLEDVKSFFRKYYVPNNASLAIVGDFEPEEARRLVAKHFGPIPAGSALERPGPEPVRITEARYRTLEDRVQLPRLYLVWPTPALFQPGDAELDVLASLLAHGKNSRLYRRLVYEEQLAQGVSAQQQSASLASQFVITVQANPGVDLDRIEQIVNEEVERLHTQGAETREVERALNNIETGYVQALQSNLNKADQLNAYYTRTGDPGYFEEDLARYRSIRPAAVQEAARRFFGPGRIVLSVVPQGKTELAASP